MDEFRVWNYARTTDQIRDNKDCIMSPDEPGLVLYYDFQNTTEFVNQDLVPDRTFPQNSGIMSVSYTHLTLPTTPYV